jgi:hypothetical protein
MALISIPQMFVILGQANLPQLGQVIAAKYPNDHLMLSPGQWIVIASGTAKEICDHLGITDGSTGDAVVVAGTSYYGRASSQIWEWMASRMGAQRV